jgi:hypothetical protein
MESIKKNDRKFVEVDKEISRKLQILCFLKQITMKDFVSQALEREIQPYDAWLDNAKKLRTEDYCNPN